MLALADGYKYLFQQLLLLVLLLDKQTLLLDKHLLLLGALASKHLLLFIDMGQYLQQNTNYILRMSILLCFFITSEIALVIISSLVTSI